MVWPKRSIGASPGVVSGERERVLALVEREFDPGVVGSEPSRRCQPLGGRIIEVLATIDPCAVEKQPGTGNEAEVDRPGGRKDNLQNSVSSHLRCRGRTVVRSRL